MLNLKPLLFFVLFLLSSVLWSAEVVSTSLLEAPIASLKLDLLALESSLKKSEAEIPLLQKQIDSLLKQNSKLEQASKNKEKLLTESQNQLEESRTQLEIALKSLEESGKLSKKLKISYMIKGLAVGIPLGAVTTAMILYKLK